MAQAQRRPEQQTEADRQIQQITQAVQNLQRMQLTPAQQDALRRAIEDMQRLAPPQVSQAPAPRRVEQFVYDVNVSGTTYRLTLNERLPTDARGIINVNAARRRLHDMLLRNEPVALGGHTAASVQMTGGSQEAARFNAGPENQRMDIFRDRYVGQTYQDGKYVENSAVTIAQVQAQRPRG